MMIHNTQKVITKTKIKNFHKNYKKSKIIIQKQLNNKMINNILKITMLNKKILMHNMKEIIKNKTKFKRITNMKVNKMSKQKIK